MPSPFPGMDPWLERRGLFPDFHTTLVTYLRESINAALPPEYAALGTKLVWVDAEQTREPDVSVLGPRRPPAGGAALAVMPGLLAVGRERPPQPWEEPYLEIWADRGERLVTAVEVLSRSNKAAGGAGRKAYLDKREEFRLGGVHTVEIDLLRGGAHTTAIPPRTLRRRVGEFDYHVAVRVAGRGDEAATFYAAPIRLADRLPAVGVPLDPGVAPVTVDLQALLDRAYDTGRYARFARYGTEAPDPPLSAEQAAWAADILRAKGVL